MRSKEECILYKNTRVFAEKMDHQDPLGAFRAQFHIPEDSNGNPYLYFCGNSLGLQPKAAKKYIEKELEDWARLGVDGHFKARSPWMPYHEFLMAPMAKIIGAKPTEVVMMNSLTANLHLMMVSFYRPTSTRYKILIEAAAFPSDQYAVKSQLQFHGFNPETDLIEVQPEPDTAVISTERIENLLKEQGASIALVLLGGVHYYSGQAFEMDIITKAAHREGCLVGFDLAHAVGNIPLRLHDWGVDFAVWCSYKYLNAGPGSVGGVFVHKRHAKNNTLPRFAGWWGHDKNTRFLMPPDFIPMHGAEGWQLSNAPVLSMASLRASLALFQEAGIEKIHTKTRKLTGFLEFLIDTIPDKRISIITPRNPDKRGCQLSIRIIGGGRKKIVQQLEEKGCIVDWREPDIIRVAPVPLYNRFMDVFDFVTFLKNIVIPPKE